MKLPVESLDARAGSLWHKESWIGNTMKIFHFEGLAGPMRVDYTAQHIVLIREGVKKK